jgi:hypothetical protein
MFDKHQPIIGKFAQQSPDNFFQVLQFTLLTIQQSLHQVPEMMLDVNKKGFQSKYLWGVKAVAWQNLNDRKPEVYDMAMTLYDAYPNPDHASSELLLYLASLPGLGLVKGGFVAQLAFGLVGCLDSHNAKRFGLTRSQLSASSFKDARTRKTKSDKVHAYLGLCAELGGCAGLWDSWCSYVASRDTYGTGSSAHDVSKLHLDALGLKE